MNKRSFGMFLAATTALVLVAGAPANAQKVRSKVGTLTCKTVPGSGYNILIHSARDVRCVFKGTNGQTARYKGRAGIGLGVDLAFDVKTNITFAVLAANFKRGANQLAGSYVGGKAAVALGVGGGAQILIGGGNKSIALQPALSATQGFQVAAGLGYLSLEPTK